MIFENKILVIRGQKVMLSFHLAEIYGIEPRALMQSVKRNLGRFPEDFMFQLTEKEFGNLKSQFVTSSWGGLRRAMPYAFTEHGIAMLSSVLNSPRAIQMNIYIIRAFIKMREILAIDKNIELKLLQFQKELDKRGEDIDHILHILKNLLDEPIKPPGLLGFVDSSK
ncbi:MAG: ORF6N domain-containing protein [bacterium]|nr:ORF6N domain-containing protein [bacterium]